MPTDKYPVNVGARAFRTYRPSLDSDATFSPGQGMYLTRPLTCAPWPSHSRDAPVRSPSGPSPALGDVDAVRRRRRHDD